MILHIYTLEKFIAPFLDFMETNFPTSDHVHFAFGDVEKYPLPKCSSELFVHKRIGRSFGAVKLISHLTYLMHRADKIVLHGLWSNLVNQIIYTMPWLLKKCYWIIWGGDLYRYSLGIRNREWQRDEGYRRTVIRKMGNLVTYVPGDVTLAREWYHAEGLHHECIMYPSNIYNEGSNETKQNTREIRILVGNSADPSNNHADIFRKIAPVISGNQVVICPLSYGNQGYAELVMAQGVEYFGKQFQPIREFQDISKYKALLGSVTFGMFAHDRQQGMGNIINLIGAGASVYLRSTTTTWDLLRRLGIKVFDQLSNDFPAELSPDERITNRRIICENFNQKKLFSQYSRIFGS